MGLLGFFAGIAHNFINHYRNLAGANSDNIAVRGRHERHSAEQQKAPVTQADTYQPAQPSDHNPPPTYNRPEVPQQNTPATDDQPETYYIRRAAHLNYKLDLAFDLTAFTETIGSLEDGDIENFRQLAAAGFGFRAGFDIHGKQVVETNQPGDGTLPEALKTGGLSRSRSRQLRLFEAHDREFAVRSFLREAVQIRQSNKFTTTGGHARAVNRFALRFRMDSSFSFAHLNRFNVQTNRMADELPDSLESYLNSAGNLAQAGTNEIMATFFDAVDAYLNQAEGQLLEKVGAFLEQAAQELGFSGSLVDVAKNHLTNSIESFFNRVDTAVSDFRTRFVPDELIQPTMPVGDPVILPAEQPAPELASDSEYNLTA